MDKMWYHNCQEKGPTATLHGETCNWCDVTFDDVETDCLKERNDIVNDPEEIKWNF